ncbi:hypothetical protein [Pseudoduganella sp. RAF53_2]|uniref:hypothetical protein n=1 Tax=unclassified Pseudoduganella TaxID=2637179 RepID=UPI003F97039F
MPKFIVVKTIQYTEEVQVEDAPTAEVAKEVALATEGKRIQNDVVIDAYVRRLIE